MLEISRPTRIERALREFIIPATPFASTTTLETEKVIALKPNLVMSKGLESVGGVSGSHNDQCSCFDLAHTSCTFSWRNEC